MFKVILKSCPNPDFGQTRCPAKPDMKTVATLAEASVVCREYIERHDLGCGNWAGGKIYDEMNPKKWLYQVSFNGRVWRVDGSEVRPDQPGGEGLRKVDP